MPRKLSDADAIHLATTTLIECETFHTGDADVEPLEAIETAIH